MVTSIHVLIHAFRQTVSNQSFSSSNFQAMFLKATNMAFVRCTSTRSTGELAKKEQQCIRSTVASYLEARYVKLDIWNAYHIPYDVWGMNEEIAKMKMVLWIVTIDLFRSSHSSSFSQLATQAAQQS